MNSKKSFLIFVLVINLSTVFGVIRCDYWNSYYGYNCDVYLYNPNGLNDFEYINGTHILGFTDNDVTSFSTYSGSVTPNIPSIICSTFKNLDSMKFMGMEITTIDDYSFFDCLSVKKLDFFYNPIFTVHEKAFNRNLDLEILVFNANNFTTLPENVFQYQQRLELLTIINTGITDLPEKIFCPLTNLKNLELDSNHLTNLRPEWFVNLQNLEGLSMKFNFITDFPKNVFSQLTKLRGLSAHGNQLKIIHADSFGFLPNFNRIVISYNLVDAIDENLIDYTGLTTIEMDHNICATGNIVDESISRDYMRSALRECFKNYWAHI